MCKGGGGDKSKWGGQGSYEPIVKGQRGRKEGRGEKKLSQRLVHLPHLRRVIGGRGGEN